MSEQLQRKSGDPRPAGVSTSRRYIRSLFHTVVVPVLIFLVGRAFLVEAFRIPSGSMENTLLVGDFLFANKLLYGAEIPFTDSRLPGIREPRLNDVVIFESVEEPGLRVVKRLVGSPGDTLRMEDNVLYRNGEPVDEPWVVRDESEGDFADPRMREWQVRHLAPGVDARTYYPTLRNWGPLVIPPDSFFVMGDNRDRSYDSRYWGFLGRDRVEGSPMIVYYSYDRNGVLPLPAVTAIRWDRLLRIPH